MPIFVVDFQKGSSEKVGGEEMHIIFNPVVVSLTGSMLGKPDHVPRWRHDAPRSFENKKK